MNTLFRVVILVLVPTILAADNGAKGESFVCVGDSTVGFIFDSASKDWEPANIGDPDTSFLVKPSVDPFESDARLSGRWPEYAVFRVGEEHEFIWCEEGIETDGWLRCSGSRNPAFLLVPQAEHRFLMNIHTRRFTLTVIGDYMTATLDFDVETDSDKLKTIYKNKQDEGGIGSMMMIGKCTEL